jgi:hypothetical protein
MEDGEIIFADIVYNMTPDERKLHIQKVLQTSKINPKIRFYVIDEELLPNAQHLINVSVFNNRKKLFLKFPARYHTTIGPRFYSVLSDYFIKETTEFMDDLKTAPYCTEYDAEKLEQFYTKFGSIINRMIDLSAFKR